MRFHTKRVEMMEWCNTVHGCLSKMFAIVCDSPLIRLVIHKFPNSITSGVSGVGSFCEGLTRWNSIGMSLRWSCLNKTDFELVGYLEVMELEFFFLLQMCQGAQWIVSLSLFNKVQIHGCCCYSKLLVIWISYNYNICTEDASINKVVAWIPKFNT